MSLRTELQSCNFRINQLKFKLVQFHLEKPTLKRDTTNHTRQFRRNSFSYIGHMLEGKALFYLIYIYIYIYTYIYTHLPIHTNLKKLFILVTYTHDVKTIYNNLKMVNKKNGHKIV